jgi:hypothetical protein
MILSSKPVVAELGAQGDVPGHPGAAQLQVDQFGVFLRPAVAHALTAQLVVTL